MLFKPYQKYRNLKCTNLHECFGLQVLLLLLSCCQGAYESAACLTSASKVWVQKVLHAVCSLALASRDQQEVQFHCMSVAYGLVVKLSEVDCSTSIKGKILSL